MLDTIQEQIRETKNRQAVMALLQALDAPMSVLKIHTPSISGELWIAKGATLCFCKIEPESGGPLLDMLRLLAVDEADFTLENCDEKEPASPISISLAEVLADEHAVARKIKNGLWPIDEPVLDKKEDSASTGSNNEDAEAVSPVKPAVLPEADANTNFVIVGSPSLGSPPADHVDNESRADVKPSDKLFDSEGTIEADLSGSLFDNETAVTLQPATDHMDDEPAVSVQPPGDHTDDEPAVSGQPPGDHFDDEATISVQPPGDHFDDEATIDVQPPGDHFDDEATISVQPPGDHFDDEATIDVQPPGDHFDDEATIDVQPPGDHLGDETTIEEHKLSDDLAEQRRSQLHRLNETFGEPASKFYEDDQQALSPDDDLAVKRQSELQSLDGVAKEDASSFHEAPVEDLSGDDDSLRDKRQSDYEELKLFYAEEPERFYEEQPISEHDEPKEGLTSFMKRILEISAAEHPEQAEVFQTVDPSLQGEDIIPVWTPESEEAKEQEPPVETPKEQGYVPKTVESPFSDAADLSQPKDAGNNLTLTPGTDELSLVARDKRMGPAARDGRSQLEPQEVIPRKVIIAAVIAALAIPTMSYVIWHFCDAQAQEELALQHQQEQFAERSIEEKSLREKPQEAFRMPASSPVNSSPPPNNSPQGISSGERGAHFTWQPPARTQSMGADQINAANNEMQKADAFLTAGYKDRAVSLYLPLIRKYPTYTLLRIKAARAYIAMQQYQLAYQICINGLDACQTRSDFDMLVSVIKEIP